MKKLIILLAIMLTGCVSPAEDAANMQKCYDELGVDAPAEYLAYCRQWANNEMIKASDGLFPPEPLSVYICKSRKLPENSPEYNYCVDREHPKLRAMYSKAEEVKKQAKHQTCADYGLRKGTKEYAECRMRIDAQEEAKSMELMKMRQEKEIEDQRALERLQERIYRQNNPPKQGLDCYTSGNYTHCQ